jgi:phage-related protein
VALADLKTGRRDLRWRPLRSPLIHDGNIYRVFFCIEGSNMVLLHGFMKKTQATPKREIEIARARQLVLRRK